MRVIMEIWFESIEGTTSQIKKNDLRILYTLFEKSEQSKEEVNAE